MRWVKVSERKPTVLDGDQCGFLVYRRWECGRSGRCGWSFFEWLLELDGELELGDEWLEGAFEDVGEVGR